MPNPSPYKARLARRSRKAGDIERLRVKLWHAIERAETFLEHGDPATVFRAVNAIAQATAPYLKAVEVGELEERLAALEALSGS